MSTATDLVADAESLPVALASHKTSSSHNHNPKSGSTPSPGTISRSPENGHGVELSRFLHASQDIDKMCTASGSSSVLAHDTMVMPFTVLEQRGLATAETLLQVPEANAHPVLLAKYMLLVAKLLQSQDIKHLSESETAIMEHLVELATSRVPKNDKFIGSIELMECLMIESANHANIGQLKRAWLAVRRAMSVAQLMGLTRARGQVQYEVL